MCAAVGSKPLSRRRVWWPIGGWVGGPAECPCTHSPEGAGSLATTLRNLGEQRRAPRGVAVALGLEDVNAAQVQCGGVQF